jgi:poly-beta-hydroxybutyrate-responsive repressor
MRKFLDPTLLLLLAESSAHGYTLLGRMQDFNLDFLNPAVIYRALRQMEDKGWVTSSWDMEHTEGPPRRVYAITTLGEEVLACCARQLESTQDVIQGFLSRYAVSDA